MDKTKISYAITIYNEIEKISILLPYLIKHKNPNDDIVIVFDSQNGSEKVLKYISNYALEHEKVYIYKFKFKNNFSDLKNYLNSRCFSEYIFQLDSDELPSIDLLKDLPKLLEINPDVEAFWVPRVNTVDSITLDHVKKWGWNISKNKEFVGNKKLSQINPSEYELLSSYNLIIDENIENEEAYVTYYKPIINFPDTQLRLYKNSINVKWKGKVHERLSGYKKETYIPYNNKYYLLHEKEINTQEQQNELYENIIK